ncbi:MAG: hypothetical protein EBV83_05990 [Verrucomicrobia bacterium]|nr:hypothetical protein [Verrucomicrobiota bacterium]
MLLMMAFLRAPLALFFALSLTHIIHNLGGMNSKAYRAVTSSKSKRYFARNKNWSGGQASNSAFIPPQSKPTVRQPPQMPPLPNSK